MNKYHAGMRLDIAAGTAVRFEPGESKTVTLVEIAGTKEIHGGNGICTGALSKLRDEVVSRHLNKL